MDSRMKRSSKDRHPAMTNRHTHPPTTIRVLYSTGSTLFVRLAINVRYQIGIQKPRQLQPRNRGGIAPLSTKLAFIYIPTLTFLWATTTYLYSTQATSDVMCCSPPGSPECRMISYIHLTSNSTVALARKSYPMIITTRVPHFYLLID